MHDYTEKAPEAWHRHERHKVHIVVARIQQITIAYLLDTTNFL